jgi:predicted nucleotidyltransferase
MSKDDLKACLSSQPAILFALLFGSRGRGTPRPDSDWDIAVYLEDSFAAKQRFDLRLRLHSELEDLGKVDLVILNEAPPPFSPPCPCWRASADPRSFPLRGVRGADPWIS